MNAVCILANNMDFFKHQAENYLPECDILVCNETRIGNKIDEIKTLLPRAIIIDSQDVVKEFSKICDTPFLHSYTMGMNILLQWYVFKHYNYDKVLFTEEDVLFTPDIMNIFNEDHNLFCVWTFSACCTNYDKLKDLKKEYVDEFDKIFNLNFTSENFGYIWKNTHIASGQRLYIRDKFDIDTYIKYLIAFYSSKVFEACWDRRKSHRSYYLDERFEGFYAYKLGYLNGDIWKYTYLELRKPEKVDFNKYKKIKTCGGIWHNAAMSHKYKWYENLKNYGLID